MRRALPILVVLAISLFLALAQGPRPYRLAALTAGNLLHATPQGRESGPTLGELILAHAEASSPTLALAPLETRGPQTEPALLQRSLLTALRSEAAANGSSLRSVTSPNGSTFRLDVTPLDSGNWHRQLHWFRSPGAAPITTQDTWTAPGKTSLFPPLVAILLAVFFRSTVIALFAGVWVGSTTLVLQAGTPGPVALADGFQRVFSHFLWTKIYDIDNTRIVLFVLCMLSMVGLLIRSGGIRGLMDAIARRARSPRSTQVATWVLGLTIFFDDYSNTVLVGSTMRPLTDRFRIAREKLAYLVDSTAAPIAGLSLLSTWIAFEVSTFSAQLPAAGIAPEAGYEVFLATLPYRFYCILTIVFVGLIVTTGRDFGPMLRAERRARHTGQLVAPNSTPMVSERANSIAPAPNVTPRALHAILPLGAFVCLTFFTILYRGGALQGAPDSISMQWLSGVLLSGSGSVPLLVGSGAGLFLAVLVCVRVGIAREVPGAAWSILSSMGGAFAILYLAWIIGMVCGELGTAQYLTALIGDSIPPVLLPAILFLLASAIAFATGSSWSTMMILLPLVVGLSFSLGETIPLGGYTLMLMSIGSVLEGSIFGDHCSPISDTTVLSSVSSASNHMDHVRTQAPYALVTMGVALAFGYLPCAIFGISPWLAIAMGSVALIALMFAIGRRADDPIVS